MNDIKEIYSQLVRGIQEIELKGKTIPYTSINGHMFSFLSKEGNIAIRLSKEDLRDFIQEYNADLMEQHGRVMKEYVKIPDSIVNDAYLLNELMIKSLNYVSGLKPKPTKKKS